MDSTPAFTLRPLSIGEIFDRAVTIYVRNFIPFTLIVLTLLAPISVLEYFVIPDQSVALSQAVDQIGHPKKAQPPFSSAEITGLVIVGLLAMILAPFANNAVAVGVARVYNGKKPDYGPSFATVFRRWLPLLGTVFLNALILVGLYIATVLFLAIIVAVGFVFVKISVPGALFISIIGLLVVLAIIPLFLLIVIAYVFAMYATSLENLSPAKATSVAYRRLFSKTEFKKALLMTLAYVGLEFGVIFLSSAVGVLFLFVIKSYALQLVSNAIITAMLSAFLTILLAVYYYDVRTRAEGLDLETDLAKLATAAP